MKNHYLKALFFWRNQFIADQLCRPTGSNNSTDIYTVHV